MLDIIDHTLYYTREVAEVSCRPFWHGKVYSGDIWKTMSQTVKNKLHKTGHYTDYCVLYVHALFF